MFKQLSQLGKNLTDELAKGLTDDLGNGSQTDLTAVPDDNSGLPREVQLKLRKFEKYEQKYPLLLQAYKTEKSKSEKIEALEKILAENTPVGNLDDAVESLPTFFKNLNDKNSMLNEEIKRLTMEQKKTDNDEQNDANEAKIRELEEQLETQNRNSKENSNKLVEKVKLLEEEAQAMKLENDKLTKSTETQLADKQKLIDQLKGQIQELEDKSREAFENSNDVTGETESLKSTIDEKQKEIDSLKAQILEISTKSQNTSLISTTTASTGKGKKKKNKKSKGGVNNASLPAPIETANLSVDMDGLQNELKDIKMKCEEWKARYEELQSSSKSTVEIETKNSALEEELVKVRDSLKQKNIEIEEVRDMLREVGNDLVDARDQIKNANSNAGKEVEEVKKELDNLRSKNATMIETYEKTQLELKAKIASLNGEISEMKLNQTTILKEKEIASKDAIEKLSVENKTLKAQLKDINAIKLTLTQREKTIGYLEEQVKQYNEKNAVVQATIEKLEKELKSKESQLTTIQNENESLKKEAKTNVVSLENYLKENGKLSERLSILQEKYDTAQNLKSNSNEQVDSIKRQCNELNVKLKESNKRIMSLEDELNEYMNTLQEKSRECDTMRRLISDQQNEESSGRQEIENKLALLTDERNKMESELALQTSRKNREIQNWKNMNDDLKSQLNQLQFREKQLLSQIEDLNNISQTLKRSTNNDEDESGELKKVAGNLKEALQKADKRISELQESNEQLMKLNSDANKKYERLSNNYRTLSSQLSTLREKSSIDRLSRPSNESIRSRSNSEVSVTSNSSAKISPRASEAQPDVNEKIAYIKNVLLGFLEHKDQRAQLLPVIAMLLQLDNNDEKRLLMNIK
ncbi:Golgin IMH1 [Nakaseomyces glabratus]|uniref:Golgin IMH1 n=1 Tax=Candida glabrata TaxID=5478 RepID=A0A0W0C5T5_CANGB|nr:Golgin IMH1 [Nakaseomyces glabratus]KTA95126.1 Golgin IMH1 [Nakaseomyces glabratus]KTA97424.1 Golgin IMH1 [Nakaseomyces glabratus]KTB06367.1 Golgin IMH1 [Nakaseomyces glabratus]KTB22107.1 Golgin IMH1 [Nakaseomyces glabratus]